MCYYGIMDFCVMYWKEGSEGQWQIQDLPKHTTISFVLCSENCKQIFFDLAFIFMFVVRIRTSSKSYMLQVASIPNNQGLVPLFSRFPFSAPPFSRPSPFLPLSPHSASPVVLSSLPIQSPHGAKQPSLTNSPLNQLGSPER